jgi:hypothetical protein
MTDHPEGSKGDGPSSTGRSHQPLTPSTYLIVSGVGLAVSVGLLVLLIFGAERILAAGLDHRVFYVLLVPLGLSAGAFAFGAMNSSGVFTQQGSREVGLTGPAMFAALVVVGGFFLVPEGGLTTLAVRVDRAIEAGGGPVPGARVTVDWGIQRITQVTDGAGQAAFVGLPPRASGVEVAVEAEGYASERRVLPAVPLDGVIRLELIAQTRSTRLTGTVFDRTTGAPLDGVTLDFGSGVATQTTDVAGNFAVDLPFPVGARVMVIGTREGARGLNTEVVVSDQVSLHLHFGG